MGACDSAQGVESKRDVQGFVDTPCTECTKEVKVAALGGRAMSSFPAFSASVPALVAPSVAATVLAELRPWVVVRYFGRFATFTLEWCGVGTEEIEGKAGTWSRCPSSCCHRSWKERADSAARNKTSEITRAVWRGHLEG